MKNCYLIYFCMAVGILLFSACKQNEVSPDNKPNVRALRTNETQTVKNSTDFAFNVFHKLNEIQPADKNQFISPFSIAMAVAMTYNGANTTTKDGIKKALSMQGLTDEEQNSAFQSIAAYLNGIDKTVTFSPANSIWYKKDLTPQTNFVEANQKYFDAEVRGLDLIKDKEGSKNTINNWVKNKTNGKIDRIIENISDDQVMFLINAIYFKGTWAYKFDKNKTQEDDFYLENGSTVRKEFMRGNATVGVYTDADKVLIDLPYGNKQFTMTLIMPNSNKSIESLLKQLTSENFANWLAKSDTTTIDIKLPKFKFEGNYIKQEFNTVLANLGMGEAFSDYADFSNLLVGFTKGDLKINEVAHKTFVQVDETGTEAAAVTSIGMVETTSSIPRIWTVNRPFIYIIREKSSGAILFIGKVMNPTIEKYQ
ncbi:serpin family protein [Xanthocytophaga agilis]|uniref:Serpin family protein n=1 Tax=Xanthocytophaga agilis TaxID=3048010 RepID=A0AAE3QW53_9BACT|nr:serpin family protein [Xanthocytophaga agilis]MDJ1499139.1 serpin family protein [Xanthocytophaga agilis]